MKKSELDMFISLIGASMMTRIELVLDKEDDEKKYSKKEVLSIALSSYMLGSKDLKSAIDDSDNEEEMVKRNTDNFIDKMFEDMGKGDFAIMKEKKGS